MTLPTPYSVTRLPFFEGEPDPYGDTRETWGSPQDVDVHGWAPPSPDSAPFEQSRSAIVRDLDLYVPTDTASAPRDRWLIEGLLFEQIGHAEDYSKGPFRFTAGLRINLKRVEG